MRSAVDFMLYEIRFIPPLFLIDCGVDAYRRGSLSAATAADRASAATAQPAFRCTHPAHKGE